RLVGAAAVEGKLGEDYLVSLGNDFQVQFGTSQVVIPGGFFHHRVRPRPTPSDFSGNTNQPIDIEDLPGPPRIMRDRLQLDPLRLARVRSRSANLTREVEVFRTKITLKNGQQAILGAGASESSRSVMVFVVRYEVVGAK
ncbi:MAG: hypothetical protein GY906_17305, partial [bacterium]|nr:hypothetical protein [bacterium]